MLFFSQICCVKERFDLQTQNFFLKSFIKEDITDNNYPF